MKLTIYFSSKYNSSELFSFGRETETKSGKHMMSCPRPLKAMVRAGKRSSLQPHSLSSALLDWTLRQKSFIFLPNFPGSAGTLSVYAIKILMV